MEEKKKIEIRQAGIGDLDRIMEIYHSAQEFMIRNGNPSQWGHFYPMRDLLEDDIAEGTCYVLTEDERICGVFVLRFGEDPTYQVIEDGAWPNDAPYLTIHRLAGDGTVHGLFRACAEFCLSFSDNLRVDTHEDNRPMRRCIEGFGFRRCGIIHVGNGTPRIAYQYTAAKETDRLKPRQIQYDTTGT